MKKCPLCNATGYVKKSILEEKILELRKRGLTMRQISKVTGKGLTTVHYHINKSNI